MSGFLYPALYALFVWWFSTGVVLLLDNLPRWTFRWSMLAGTAIFAVSVWRLGESSTDVSEAGAYAAFTYAILAWAWQEMSFFMGYVTGPRRAAAPVGASAWTRFRLGVAASIWHELAILATASAIVALTWHAPNQVGTWTFMLLWLMRTSAKLNVVLGVLNLGEEFLPPHLRYLLSFMARRPMNLLMPVSLTAGTIGAVLLGQAALSAGSLAQMAGFTMLTSILTLAVIEHWFLILPLPFARLWDWALHFKTKPGVSVAPGEPARGTGHGLSAFLPQAARHPASGG